MRTENRAYRVRYNADEARAGQGGIREAAAIIFLALVFTGVGPMMLANAIIKAFL